MKGLGMEKQEPETIKRKKNPKEWGKALQKLEYTMGGKMKEEKNRDEQQGNERKLSKLGKNSN